MNGEDDRRFYLDTEGLHVREASEEAGKHLD
jgi:hypothetical protein